MTMDVIHPGGDPQVGNLATPINSSDFTKAFINSLPAYRAGLSAQRRGLEVGMAHGYLLFGPFAYASHFRNSELADFVGVVSAVILVLILTICLSLYSSTGVAKPVATVTTPNPPESLGNSEGWSDFTQGFLIGGMGGAVFAYIILQIVKAGILAAIFNG
jgi:photosystem I subunit XI